MKIALRSNHDRRIKKSFPLRDLLECLLDIYKLISLSCSERS